ncbi:MAG TPA: zf-HC2 domain-containing protein [bacterium]|nr:zf-HC2 domain-containing protein [bacterium]
MMKLLAGTHAEVREFLLDYLERELPLLKRWQFRLHLLMCPNCSAYLSRYRSSVSLARNYLDDPPPPELVDLTLQFLAQRLPEQDGNASPTP